MDKKKLIIAIVALVLVAALVVVYFATRPKTQEGIKNFTVTVVHSNGETKTFTYTTTREYVGQVLQEEGLIEGTQEAYGLYMKVVDGERAVYEESGAYWAFYVGEEYAQLGIDETPITDGAVYKLVYAAAESSGLTEEAQTEHTGGSN